MHKIIVFSKLKWQKIDFHITSSKQCGQLTGEHVGIATCYVDVDIGLDIETIDKPLELFDILNLIQKDIVWFVFDQQIFDMGVNLVDVAKESIKEEDKQYITIFTKDDNSRMAILRQFWKMGINMQRLYAQSKLQFICTEEDDVIEKVNAFKRRLEKNIAKNNPQ